MEMKVNKMAKRAKTIKPYPRHGTAWVYSNVDKKEIEKQHAIISRARFGSCGYQGIDFGLSIELKLQDGFSMSWSFYSMEDIYELMDRTKSKDLNGLVGKSMFGLTKGFNQVVGVDVNDELVLGRDDEDLE